MTTIYIPRLAPNAIQTNQWIRNGRYPDAFFQASIVDRANRILRWRTKEVFSYECPLANVPSSESARVRCRFAFHSSTHARYLYTQFVAAPVDVDPTASNAYVELAIDNAGSSVGTADFRFGFQTGVSSPSSVVPSKMGHANIPLNDGSGNLVEIPADTDLTGAFADFAGARLVSASVYEVSLEPTTANGYLGNPPAAMSPIWYTDQGDVIPALSNAWKRNSAPLFHWYVDLESAPRTRISATGINVVDNSSTTVSSSTPGWTIDLTHRNRQSSTTVPCTFKVYAKMSSGTGNVKLLDSGGVAVATINVNSSTAQWWSTTANLPTTLAKYDLLINGDATNTLSAYAASLYQYEA